ncbi:MAG: rhodanese-like domain-containing protein [Desulfobacter postgatei]|uniref:rhodanese-like domain-containing protein n=1 Tax=Desulfobacter postgatei TaxID=2293 RepID=UPI0023F2DD65|nr:rhodanese-like domain-containing protein [Desulfobacter postgatei]MDD4273074.1 rhodanese-like domain-containing protein [Desulfobacter postgatei]
MSNWDELLRSMTFDFFGSGGHKIEMENLLVTKEAIFLYVRSRQEWESLQIRLEHHIRVLWIPIDEIPDRYNEIPRDKTVGVFCSAGTRSTIVYMYLRSLGYENVRIAPSNYDAITSQLLPGKLHRAISNRKTEQGRD